MKTFRDTLRNVKSGWVYKYVHKSRDISARIRHAMSDECVSSAELSRRLKVSPAAVSQMIGPEANLTVKSLVKIADALNVSSDSLFSGVDSEINLNIEVKVLDFSNHPIYITGQVPASSDPRLTSVDGDTGYQSTIDYPVAA